MHAAPAEADSRPGNLALWIYSAAAGFVAFAVGMTVAAVAGVERGPLRMLIIGTTVVTVSVGAGLAADSILRRASSQRHRKRLSLVTRPGDADVRDRP